MQLHIFQLIRKSESFAGSIESTFGEWLGASFPSDEQIRGGQFWVPIKSGKAPSQDVIGSFANDLIVSSRLRDLFWDYSVPDFIRAIPLEIRFRRKRIPDQYYVVHEYNKWVDVADEQLSVPKYAGKVLTGYSALVIDKRKLPDWDLIPILPCQWLVSERLRSAILNEAYTGLGFADHCVMA